MNMKKLAFFLLGLGCLFAVNINASNVKADDETLTSAQQVKYQGLPCTYQTPCGPEVCPATPCYTDSVCTPTVNNTVPCAPVPCNPDTVCAPAPCNTPVPTGCGGC